jgi:hypothetical protein
MLSIEYDIGTGSIDLSEFPLGIIPENVIFFIEKFLHFIELLFEEISRICLDDTLQGDCFLSPVSIYEVASVLSVISRVSEVYLP